MAKTKTYDELTFTDDFMFCKIMTTHLDICKDVLELITGLNIREVKVPEGQKSIEITADGRGIRLDVYLDDEADTVYDIEMQTTYRSHIAKRSRYYQSMIDLNLIERGADFSKLNNSFVIFICMEKPFRDVVDLPAYTFKNICLQNKEIELGDETTKIFMNVSTENEDIPEDLKNFFGYLKWKMPKDDLCRRIDKSVNRAIEHKEWRSDYMTLQAKYWDIMSDARAEGLEEGRAEGRAEGKAEGKAEGRSSAIIELVRDGVITAAEGAKRLSISVDELMKHLVGSGDTSSL